MHSLCLVHVWPHNPQYAPSLQFIFPTVCIYITRMRIREGVKAISFACLFVSLSVSQSVCILVNMQLHGFLCTNYTHNRYKLYSLSFVQLFYLLLVQLFPNATRIHVITCMNILSTQENRNIKNVKRYRDGMPKRMKTRQE